jgi:hypothetical protein
LNWPQSLPPLLESLVPSLEGLGWGLQSLEVLSPEWPPSVRLTFSTPSSTTLLVVTVQLSPKPAASPSTPSSISTTTKSSRRSLVAMSIPSSHTLGVIADELEHQGLRYSVTLRGW